MEEQASDREYRGTSDATIEGDRNSFFKCHNLTIKGKGLYLEDCTDCTVEGTVDEIKRGNNIRVKGKVQLVTDVGLSFGGQDGWFTCRSAVNGVFHNDFGGRRDEEKKPDKERQREQDKEERRSSRKTSSGVAVSVGKISAGRSATVVGGQGGRVEVGSVSVGGRKVAGATVIGEDGSVTVDGALVIGKQSGPAVNTFTKK